MELSKVARHDSQPTATRVACDQQIIAADHLAPLLEAGADVGGMTGCVGIEWQHLQSRREALDFAPVVVSAVLLKRSRTVWGRSRSTRIQRLVSNR